MLLDLQLMRITNPSVDLVYLLCSSTSNTARKERLEEWLHVYHDTLMTDLKLLGYAESVYPFEELVKDIDHSFLFGSFLGVMHCQVIKQNIV